MDPVLSNKPFPLLVTGVRHVQRLVQIIGQTDAATASLVERYLITVREQLDGGVPPQASALESGWSELRLMTWIRRGCQRIHGHHIQFGELGPNPHSFDVNTLGRRGLESRDSIITFVFEHK